MTIIIDGKLIPEEQYKDEKELQDILCDNPALLQSEGNELYLLKREFPLKSGTLDILYLDKNKNVVAVEVKLYKNPETRRDVVGQILDYVSDIANLSYRGLDKRTSNELQKLIDDKFQNEPGIEEFIEGNLRQGKVKLIVAVDKAKDGLERIVKFLCDHAQLDIALVAISKYTHDGVGIFVPKVTEKRTNPTQKGKARKRKCPLPSHLLELFEKLLEHYESNNSLTVDQKDQSKDYRRIHIDEWKNKNIHYEFNIRGDYIGVEFHMEKTDKARLQDFNLQEFKNHSINEYKVDFDPQSAHVLKIMIPFTEENIDTICDTMRQFIELTKPVIDKFLEI